MPFATLRFTPRILCTEPLRCQNRKACCDALRKSKHQEHNRSRRTNCSQCIRSDISANDNRVCHVVELLENVSDNQRQRKLQNDRKRTSLCHVFFHEKTSSK